MGQVLPDLGGQVIKRVGAHPLSAVGGTAEL